jgi:hypothetical protein
MRSKKLEFNELGLLDPGMYEPTIYEFRETFVDSFPNSETRGGLYNGYMEYSKKCIDDSFVKKHWVDGSYVTDKIDPGDIDLAMLVDANKVRTHVKDGKTFDHGRSEYLTFLKKEYGCHVFVVMGYPEDDPRYVSVTKRDSEYWQDKWGHTKEMKKRKKGYVQFDFEDRVHCENVNKEIGRRKGA